MHFETTTESGQNKSILTEAKTVLGLTRSIDLDNKDDDYIPKHILILSNEIKNK